MSIDVRVRDLTGHWSQPLTSAQLSAMEVEAIDISHAHIHDGIYFSVCDTVASDTTTVQWMIITPNTTTYSHMFFQLSCTGEATFKVTEGADRSAGTGLSLLNRRRVGVPTVAGTTVSRTPTGGTTDGAITLFEKRVGISGSGSKNLEGAIDRNNNEWILKPNTKYVVSVTTYAATYSNMELDWYETID